MGVSADVTVNVNWVKATIAVSAATYLAMRICAEQVLMDSKENCPYDTGMLENSGSTQVTLTKAKVFYDTPYARRLHEHPEYNFQGKGKGKWLETALNQNQTFIINTIKSNIGGEL